MPPKRRLELLVSARVTCERVATSYPPRSERQRLARALVGALDQLLHLEGPEA